MTRSAVARQLPSREPLREAAAASWGAQPAEVAALRGSPRFTSTARALRVDVARGMSLGGKQPSGVELVSRNFATPFGRVPH